MATASTRTPPTEQMVLGVAITGTGGRIISKAYHIRSVCCAVYDDFSTSARLSASWSSGTISERAADSKLVPTSMAGSKIA